MINPGTGESSTPTFQLVEPITAPQELLANVETGPQGHYLEVATPIGCIALGIGWSMTGSGEYHWARFKEQTTRNRLPEGMDPEMPFVEVTERAFIRLMLKAPTKSVRQEWSISEPPDQLSLERSRPTLMVAARIAGEPVIRRQSGSGEHFIEEYAGGFKPKARSSPTAQLTLNETSTRIESSKPKRKRLRFTSQHVDSVGDGHVPTIEVIVATALETQVTDPMGTFVKFIPKAIDNIQPLTAFRFGLRLPEV